MSTEAVVQQLLTYHETHAVRAPWYWLMLNLSEAQILQIIAGATTIEQGWVRMRDYFRQQALPPGVTPPKGVPKMTTADYQSRIRDISQVTPGPGRERPWCWEAAVDAFGVATRTGKPESMDVINTALRDGGWELRKLSPAEIAPAGITPTLAVFMNRVGSGDFMVYTPSHAIAVRDGVVTDTMVNATVKRRITAAYELTPKERKVTPEGLRRIHWPHPRCECPDPVVGGHQGYCPALRTAATR